MLLPSPADGHTCDLQVLDLATEPRTPGQGERDSLEDRLQPVFVCACSGRGISEGLN